MITPACPHRPPCSACPRYGERGISSDARRSLRELAQSHGIEATLEDLGPPTAFRHRARLAIRGRRGSPKIGLFELDSHRVVHVPNCVVQHPLINRAADIVRRSLVDAGVSCYSDEAHLGLARYLQVVIERRSQSAQIVLVANTETPAPLDACLSLIHERLGNDLHSLWMNSNTERTNTIMGSVFHRWSGPDSIIERFGGADVHYPPGAFGQSNLDIATDIIEHLRRQISPGADIVEFYAGVGAIGLSILSQASRIRFNEIGEQSLLGLERGLAGLDPESRAKASVIPGPANAATQAVLGATVVIADPPRKGLDPELAAVLGTNPPDRFLYVSCGLDSFLRDTAVLTAPGRLALNSLAVFDLLPYTHHVEIVAGFNRRDRVPS